MKHRCLVYHEEAAIEALPEEERAGMVADVLAYTEELRRGGRYVASSPLEPVRSAATVRVREGRVAGTDGPCAQTREHLGGFSLIEARDRNDAIRLAARMPPARVGSIEVRALAEIAPG